MGVHDTVTKQTWRWPRNETACLDSNYYAFTVVLLVFLQPYELLNLADALERQYYQDGQCIIKQVSSNDWFGKL